jgi:hypothetical protein
MGEERTASVELVEEAPALLAGSGCRMLRLRRGAAGFRPGDLLLVVPGAEPEGGEWVIDLKGRLGRHGGGPVWGIVVGVVRQGPEARSARRTE